MDEFRIPTVTAGDADDFGTPARPPSCLSDSFGTTLLGSPGLAVHLLSESNDASASPREAILRELYDERNSLLTKRRTGKLQPAEVMYLADVERELDKLEADEGDLRKGELYTRVEKLAERILAARSNR